MGTSNSGLNLAAPPNPSPTLFLEAAQTAANDAQREQVSHSQCQRRLSESVTPQERGGGLPTAAGSGGPAAL